MSYPAESSAGAAQHHRDEDEEVAPQPAASHATHHDTTREPLYARDIWGEMLEHEAEHEAELRNLEAEQELAELLQPVSDVGEELPDDRRQAKDKDESDEEISGMIVGGTGVTLWDASGAILGDWGSFPMGTRASFSPDGKRLAVAHDRGYFRLFVVSLAELVGPRREMHSVDDWTPVCGDIFTTEQEFVVKSTCFSPCGRFLAAGIRNPKVTALLWDVESGNVVCTLQWTPRIHTGRV